MDQPHTPHRYPQADIDAIYRVIAERRDMRHFIPGAVDDACLRRVLEAAHAAPSVGFMQPWRFVRIRNVALRQKLAALVDHERLCTAEQLDQRQAEFLKLKVEGISDCAELIAVGLMDQREPHIFGRRTLPEMDLASAACAIQNMWLAARAEGLGMGWVSLFDPIELKALLKMPPGSQPIALLCLGPVAEFYPQPMLEQSGWAERRDLDTLITDDYWQQDSTP